jgi:hypothetical protein
MMPMPFQKLPILLPGNPEGGEKDKTVMARILPGEIESFNDGYHFGCLIKFKSGEILMTELSADQVETMIGQYWQKFNEMVRKAQGGSGLLLQ